MNLSDTFYLALCMTILILGVVYWFWTQNQYMQRKLNLLENIVFEMKTNWNAANIQSPTDDGIPESSLAATAAAVPAASIELAPLPADDADDGVNDDGLDQFHAELHDEFQSAAALEPIGMKLAPVAEEDDEHATSVSGMVESQQQVPDDLRPGGVGSGMIMEPEEDTAAPSSVLESMSVKELQRLAVQKGISGVNSMRKRAVLIEAIRNATSSLTPFDA